MATPSPKPKADPYAEFADAAATDPFAEFEDAPGPAADSIPQRMAQYAGVINRAAAPYLLASRVPFGPAALAATDVLTSLVNVGARALGKEPPLMTGSEAIQSMLPDIAFREPETKPQRILSTGVEAATGGKVTANQLAQLASTLGPSRTRNVLTELGKKEDVQAAVAAGSAITPQTAFEYFGVTDPTQLALLSAAGGVVTAGGAAAMRGKPLTVAKLKETSEKRYGEAEQSGVVFSPQSYDSVVTTIKQRLSDSAYNPRAESPIKNVLAALDEKKGVPLDAKEFDKLRQIANDAAASNDKATRRLAKVIIKELDTFVDNATPQDVVSGNINQYQGSIRAARDAYARAMRGEEIEELIRRAKLAGGTTRDYQREFKNFRNSRNFKKRIKSFSPEQIAAIEKTASSGGYIDILDAIGELSPIARHGFGLPGNIIAGLGTSLASDVTPQSYITPENFLKLAAVSTASRVAANQLAARRARLAGELMRDPTGTRQNVLSGPQIAFPIGVNMLEQAPVLNYLSGQ